MKTRSSTKKLSEKSPLVKSEQQESKKRKAEKSIDVKTSTGVAKEQIIDFISRLVGKDYSRKVLVDIIFSEKPEHENSLTVVGRSETIGSSTKQMRHVTPCAFLIEIIKSNILGSLTPYQSLEGIIKFVILLLPQEKGAAFSSQDLELYDTSLGEAVISSSSKHMEYSASPTSKGKQKVHFVSPNKMDQIIDAFNTPTKLNIAIEKYQTLYGQFCKAGFKQLIEAVKDDTNDATIAAEAIARMIFILFNQRDNAVYPTEGNTLSTEIRYYRTMEDAAAKNKDYEVLTAKELKDKISQKNDINGKVRIVDCEGSQVKKSKDALESLNKMLSSSINFLTTKKKKAKIDDYNKNYNKLVKLTNEILDPLELSKISPYNINISEKATADEINYHVAKHLFVVFDYKALEEDVFVQSRTKSEQKTYSAYTTAKTDNLSYNFQFLNGDDYRTKSTLVVQSYNDQAIFRNEEQLDLDESLPLKLSKLATKIVEHAFICLLSFTSLSKKKVLDSVLEKFTKIISYEHNVEEQDLYSNVKDLAKTKMSHMGSISNPSKESKICFKENELYPDILTNNNAIDSGLLGSVEEVVDPMLF